MSITLDAITLPADLIWTDEFSWSPVTQGKSYSLTGAMYLETGIKQAGRPITLTGQNDAAWADRATVKALFAKLADNATMMLTLNDARTFSVVFDHERGPIESAAIIDYSSPIDADYQSLILKLMQV